MDRKGGSFLKNTPIGAMAEPDDLEVAQIWKKFSSRGGSRRDWDNLMLKPEWPDQAVSWIAFDDEDHSAKMSSVFETYLQRGDMVEYVVRNQRGDSTGEALGRVEAVRAAKGHFALKLVHLATSDSLFDTWAIEHFNSNEDFEVHFCRKDAGLCQIKPFSKRAAFFHTDTFRLMPFWMGVKLPYAREAVLTELSVLVTAWIEQEAGGAAGSQKPPADGLEEPELEVEENPLDEAEAPTYGGAAEAGGSKPPARARKKLVEQTTSSKAGPPEKRAPERRPVVEGDREAKGHALAASRALTKRSPEMVRRAEASPPQRSKQLQSGPSRPKVELKGRREGASWMDQVGDYKDDSSVAGRDVDRRGPGGGPPGGGGPGKPGDSSDDEDEKKPKKTKKKKSKDTSSSSSSRKRKVRASHLVPLEKKKKRKKPSDDGDDSSSSGRGGKKKKGSDKKKPKKEKASDKQRKKKKRRKDSSGERSSNSRSTDTDEDLYGKDAQRYQSLLQKAKRRPGKLLKKGLEQMSQYLAARVGETEDVAESWRDQRVGAYLSQVLFTQHPPKEIGVRNVRELITLGECIDLLMSNELPRLGDVLMQRLKAVEASLSEGWAVASQQELIPGPRATLTAPAEKSFAAKQALQHQKLEDLLKKRRSG